MTDNEIKLARLLAAAMVAHALKNIDRKPLPIRPTMRPDPEAVTVSHGMLISHGNA